MLTCSCLNSNFFVTLSSLQPPPRCTQTRCYTENILKLYAMCFLLENNSTSTHGCCLNPYPLDNEPAGNLSAPHHCALTLIRHPHLPPANILTPRGGRAHRWLPVLKMLPDESKLVNILTRRTIVLLCCGVNRLIGFLSSVAHFIAIAMEKGTLLSVGSRPLWRRYFLPRVFPSFFLQKQVLLCIGHVWRRISHTGATVPTKSYHHSGPSPTRPNELWTCPDTEPPS